MQEVRTIIEAILFRPARKDGVSDIQLPKLSFLFLSIISDYTFCGQRECDQREHSLLPIHEARQDPLRQDVPLLGVLDVGAHTHTHKLISIYGHCVEKVTLSQY